MEALEANLELLSTNLGYITTCSNWEKTHSRIV